MDNITPNITYIKNKINKGPGAARNLGLKRARGKYIVFLDCDDYWDIQFLEKVINALENNPNVIMGYANGYYVDCNGKEIEEMRKNSKKPNSILPHILQYGRPWGTAACIWNAKKIKGIKWLETRSWEDYAFDVHAAIICNEVLVIKEHLVFYDNSGNDKLSNQNVIQALKYKNESLQDISKQIQKSIFFDYPEIKKCITKLVINNTIALLNNRLKDNSYYMKNIKVLKNYQDDFSAFTVLLSTKVHQKFGLWLLRYYRKHFLFKNI